MGVRIKPYENPDEFVLVKTPALDRVLSPGAPGIPSPNPRDPRFEKLDELIRKEDQAEARAVKPPTRGAAKLARLNKHAAEMRRRAELREPKPVSTALPKTFATHLPLALPPRIKTLLSMICNEFGISFDSIRNGRDHRHVVIAARRKAIFELRDMGFGRSQTGRYLGIHHTSVIHALACTTPPNKREEIAFQNLRNALLERETSAMLLKTYTCPAGELPAMDLSGEWAI